MYYKAISEAGTTDRDAVRDAIAEHRADELLRQRLLRLERGVEDCKSMGVAQTQDGKPVVVWPEEFAEAELVYPAPGA